MKLYFALMFIFLQFTCSYAQKNKSVRDSLKESTLIPYRDGNKWGFSNGFQEIIIKPKFKEVGFFYSKSIKYSFAKKKNYFFIDRNGKKLNKNKYLRISQWSFKDFKITTKNDSYYLDGNLKKVQQPSYCGGSFAIYTYFNVFSSNELNGVYSIEKKIKSEALWKNILPNHKGTCAVLKDSLWAIIDKNLNFVQEYQYQEVLIKNRHSGIYYVKKDNKWGILRQNGTKITEAKYFKIESFLPFNLVKAWISNTYWFYIDANGTEYYDKNNVKGKDK